MTRRIAVVVNPAAGRGRAGWLAKAVVDRLDAAGLAVRLETPRQPTETLDLARQAVADELDGLVVLGGDGIAHLAVQAAAGTDTTVGLVPCGSGNDLARALGIPRRDPLAAADLVIAGHGHRVDLGRVGDTWFATVLTVGFSAHVAERVGRMRRVPGELRYPLGVAGALRRWRPAAYVVEADGERLPIRSVIVAVGNTASFGGGVRICDRADPADGQLDLTIVADPGLVDLARLAPRLFRGRAFAHPAITTRRARTIGLATPDGVAPPDAYADGERVGPLPVHVECVPGALRIYGPPPS